MTPEEARAIARHDATCPDRRCDLFTIMTAFGQVEDETARH